MRPPETGFSTVSVSSSASFMSIVEIGQTEVMPCQSRDGSLHRLVVGLLRHAWTERLELSSRFGNESGALEVRQPRAQGLQEVAADRGDAFNHSLAIVTPDMLGPMPQRLERTNGAIQRLVGDPAQPIAAAQDGEARHHAVNVRPQ